MNKKVFLMGALMASVTLTQAQTVLTPHFTDASKKIAVPKYAQVNPEIHNGLIAIYANGMLYADTTGKYVVGTNFPVSVNTMYYSGYFSGGAAMVWRKKPDASSASACIIYPDGTYRDVPTVKPKNWVMGAYDVRSASDFCDGYAVVTKGTMMSFNQVFIDKNGKEVFPALTSKGSGSMGDANIYPVRENRRVYYNAELKKYGYADEKGNVVIKPQFNKAQAFSEGLAAVMLEENYAQKWGFIDPTGKMVIPATYNLKPGRFSEGLAAVRIGSESEYEMAYIDKTGKRVIENKKWDLNEFHNGYAWVGTGCDKLFVWNTKFEEVRDVTKDFEHGGNGFGTCNFQMYSGTDTDRDWGFDFPNGMQSLNQDGVKAGDIFAPDGTTVFKGKDAKDEIFLYNVTEGGLIFCNAWLSDARLKEEGETPCFINQKGEIVFYFQESVEGFEGPAPVEAKATPTPTAKPAAKPAATKKK